MQLIRVTSKRKEILKYTKKLGLYGLYKDVRMHMTKVFVI